MNNKTCDVANNIRYLLNVMNQKPGGFAFITKKNKLIGLFTDGDIRRLLLEHVTIDDPISSLDIKMCKFAYDTDDYEQMMSQLNEKIRILPIVDKNMNIVNYIQHDKRSYIPIAEPNLVGNELKYVTDALLSTWISSTGKYIDRFEADFSKFIGMDYAVAASSGTSALHLALMSLDVGEGDEVILPDLTFAATINSVLHSNATPVIVDVDEKSWCINPSEIEKAITSKTKAIIAVHLYGQPCNMDMIMNLAKKYNLKVIEDCAEAHGAEYKDKKVGSFGNVSCFSFFGNKIITTGEGGMCLTNSNEINTKLRILRDHGMNKSKKYWHDMIGYNYRMTNLQAAIGCAQLERIDEILSWRQKIEDNYTKIFKKYPFIKIQNQVHESKKIPWLVSALIIDKDINKFIEHFRENGIDVRNLFYPLSSMEIYEKLARSDNIVTRRLSKSGVSFPTHNNVDFDHIEEVLSQMRT